MSSRGRTPLPRPRAALTAALVTLAALVLPVLAAAPAAAEVPSTLSDVRVSENGFTASLVLRSDRSVAVDPESVRVTIGGEPAQAEVTLGARAERSTMLVIDTSGSMEASGMATVRAAVAQFLETVPDDVRVGMVSFASTSGVDVAPTTDHAAVSKAVGGLRSAGETSLYRAVQDAVGALGTKGERSIVLLSDGGDTVAALDGGSSREASQREAALSALRKAKVRAEVVAFRTPDADNAVLEQFATVGGGSVVSADSSDAATTAFSAAARALESQAVLSVTRPAGVSGSQAVVVSGTASGEEFTSSSAVDLGDTTPVVVDGEETDTPPGDTSAAGPTEQPRTIASSLLIPSVVVVFLGLFLLTAAVAAPAFRSRRSQRVAAVQDYGFARGTHRQEAVQASVLGEQLIHAGDQFMQGRESTTRTMALLTRADLPWRAGEWLLIRIMAVVLGGTLGYLPFSVLGVVGGAVLGLVLPAVVLRILAARRARAFDQTLPDVLMLVATSLSTGFSLAQALDSVAQDAPEPCAKEFSRALASTRIGADVSDALDTTAERMDSHNLRWTTMAIRIQREVGGNLAETLRTTAATLREREMLRRQVRALSAEGRLSAYILIGLPIALFSYMMLVNRDYISLLWTTLYGIIMSVLGIVALIVGVFWMRKVVEIEV